MLGYPQVVVIKEKVYIGGGQALSARDSQAVVIYNPQHDSYDTLPPYTYQFFSMAVINNQLVLVGGRDIRTKKTTSTLGVWSEQSNGWTHPFPPMTKACEIPSVATHNNRWLVVMGGHNHVEGLLSRVEILDTVESRQWYHAASLLPQPFDSISSVTIGNTCYILGGRFTSLEKKVLRVRIDHLVAQAVSSASAPPTPPPWLPDTPLQCFSAFAYNGALLAVGESINTGSKAIYHYQPSKKSWIKAGELPIEQSCARYFCTVLPSGDLYVTGGSTSGCPENSEVFIASIL